MNLNDSQLQTILQKQDNIRQVGFLGSRDHGKWAVIDQLIKECEVNVLTDNVTHLKRISYSNRPEVVMLYHKIDILDKKIQEPYLINLVRYQADGEQISFLTDGAVILVDAVEGFTPQTQYQVHQALQQKVKPILMINKLDLCILHLQLSGEEIYNKLNHIIQETNKVIANFSFENSESFLFQTSNNVVFGSAFYEWAFTCNTFANLYSEKFGIDAEKLDQKSLKWCQSSSDQKRAFVAFILDPIIKLHNVIMNGQKDQLEKLLIKLNLYLTPQQLSNNGKQLMKIILSKWLNLSKTLLNLIVLRLPSPKQAQEYRSNIIIQNEQDDAITQSIKECNPQGPLVIQIFKMLPKQYQNYYAFGRVFSGTIKLGQTVKILGPDYIIGKKLDLFELKIDQLKLITNNKVYEALEIPSGNLVALGEIDRFIHNICTITDHPGCFKLNNKSVKFTNIVRILFKVKNIDELPKLLLGCGKLQKQFERMKYYTEDSGLHIISGSTPEEVESYYQCLLDLIHPVELVKLDNFVEYKEIISTSSQDCVASTQNKRISLKFSAEPLKEDLVEILDHSIFKQCKEQFQIDQSLYAENIWALNPQMHGANILVNTWQVQHDHIDLIKDNLIQSWSNSMQKGVLCQENLRGMKVNVLDVNLAEGNQRHSQQIQVLGRKLISMCQLKAIPKLQEPMFSVEIYGTNEVAQKIYTTLIKNQGQVYDEHQIEGTQFNLTKAYIPADNLFQFSVDIRAATQGTTSYQFAFDHWSTIQGDPFDKNSRANYIIAKIRSRKGLKADLPALEDFLDEY